MGVPMARGIRIFMACSVIAAVGLAPTAGSALGELNAPIVCHAFGPASTVTSSGTLHWGATLTGSCTTNGDTYLVNAGVSGTSSTCGPSGVLKHLRLDATVTYSPYNFPEAVSGFPATLTQEGWRAETTSSIGVTPFLVTEAGKRVGAGNVGLRLMGNCAGKSTLSFAWVRTAPNKSNPQPILCQATGTVDIPYGMPGWYRWILTGDGVCTRAGDSWDISFVGYNISGSLGVCGDLTSSDPTWSHGFDVQADWTNRSTGQYGYMNLFWNQQDVLPTPFVIAHSDGVVSTDPADGCWALGSIRPAEFRFLVVPAPSGMGN